MLSQTVSRVLMPVVKLELQNLRKISCFSLCCFRCIYYCCLLSQYM